MKMASALFEHIRLQGSAGFIERTQAALACLRKTACSAEVWNLLTVVRKAKRTGVHAHKTVPIIDVGLKSWNSRITWYAAGIGHEGFHIKLYREAKEQNRGNEPDIDSWAGVDGERKCLQFQLRVLQELNVEEYVLDYYRELIKAPNYMGDPTSIRDYLRRNW